MNTRANDMVHVPDELQPVALVKEGAESARKHCPSRVGLGDLPEPCIASILRLTTPRDVARLACVNTIFRSASDSDLVWETKLPPAYEDILAQAPDAPPKLCSKEKIYDFLCNRVLLENGTKDYWLDRATGGICQSIGARGLSIIWGDDTRYWDWRHRRLGSRYSEVAYLKLVWWLEIQGRLECFLSPGTYTLSWRMFHQFKDVGPVQFSFEATGNEEVQTICYFTPQGAKTRSEEGQQESVLCRWDQRTWMELDVGEFTVESKDLPVSVRFSLMETESGIPKHGLYLDGVVIRPQNLIQNLTSGVNQSTGETSNDRRDADPLWSMRRLMRRFRWIIDPVLWQPGLRM